MTSSFSYSNADSSSMALQFAKSARELMMKLSYFGCLTGPAFEDFGVYIFCIRCQLVESARCLWGPGIGGLQIPIRFGSGSMACKLISTLNRLRGVGSQLFEIMMNGRLAVAIGCRKSIRHIFFLGSLVRRGESSFVRGSEVDGWGSSGIMGHWHRQFLHTSAVCACGTVPVLYCTPRSRYRQGIWTRKGGGRSFSPCPVLPSFSFRE